MKSTRNSEAKSYRRGVQGYEAARLSSMWNARVPERFPDVIVRANSVDEVSEALSVAALKDFRVAIKSGGHSWSGNHLRDGGMLLDLSGLNAAFIDKTSMRAVVQPGCCGDELAALLAKQDLFFPVGHCKGVGVGGYLLQGGYGWHSRRLGPACASVIGLDIVTADGVMVYASAEENADLFWAARGAGPGFFGVVTAFHLRLYQRPKIIGFTVQTFPISMLEEVFRWAYEVGPSVPDSVELMLLMTSHALGVAGKGIVVIAPVFADSLEEARSAIEFMRINPLAKRASFKLPFIPSGLRFLLRVVKGQYPDNHRYAVDNMWTHAHIDELLPGLKKIAETMPPAPSHMLWMNWMPPAERPADMAYSMEDNTYIALYAGWKNEKDDSRHADWAVSRIREMEAYASGCQLADENLGQRPARFMSDDNMARMEQLRAQYDPDGRFYPWMGRLK